MRPFARNALRASLLIAALAIAGCETAEERAEKHFESAKSLAESGDVTRAIVELKNVFKLNGLHKDARLMFAQIQEDRGDTAEAFKHYRLLVEQYPELVSAHSALGRLALTLRDWETSKRHVDIAYEINPTDPMLKALKSAILYRDGEKDEGVALAREALEETPDNLFAHSVLSSAALEANDLDLALRRVNEAIFHVPDDIQMYVIKLFLLQQQDDQAELGRTLELMVEKFPEEREVEANLIRWYISQDQTDKAEASIRARAEAGDYEDWMALTRFLLQVRDHGAAVAELDDRIAATDGEDQNRYQRAKAAILFDMDDRDGALDIMRRLTEISPATDDVRLSQVTLARMYNTMGRAGEAQALVEQALETDPTMVDALKMRAVSSLEKDDTDGALRDLRAALDQDARDPQILTLMAQVHLREGARELAGERLALAVEVSNKGVDESVRYARYLIADDRLGPAESVTVDALRRDPQNIALLGILGQIHLGRQDYLRAEQVTAILQSIDTPRASAVANELQARTLQAQEKTEDMIALLEELAGGDDAGLRQTAPLIRAYVRDGQIEKAEQALTGLEQAYPDSPAVKMLRAGMYVMQDQPGEAETTYRDLVASFPNQPQPYLSLYALMVRQGRISEASDLLDTAVEATGRNARILQLKATVLERNKNFEDAIAIYEELYEQQTGNLVIANNLASMIATHRPDAESLERAFVIARRLRGTEFAPFQDTYGWIMSRRGDYEEALTYLEPAAAGLTSDPLVQYHLGFTQAKAGQRDAAIETLERALEIAGEDSGLPQMATAAELLEELRAQPAQPTEEAPEAGTSE